MNPSAHGFKNKSKELKQERTFNEGMMIYPEHLNIIKAAKSKQTHLDGWGLEPQEPCFS